MVACQGCSPQSHLEAQPCATVASGPSSDAASPVPYLYVAPGAPHRPGDPAFWNAPFGAVELRVEGLAATEEVERAVAFFEGGLHMLAEG